MHLCMSSSTFHQCLVSFCVVRNLAMSKEKSGLCPQLLGGNLSYLTKVSLFTVSAGRTQS